MKKCSKNMNAHESILFSLQGCFEACPALKSVAGAGKTFATMTGAGLNKTK